MIIVAHLELAKDWKGLKQVKYPKLTSLGPIVEVFLQWKKIPKWIIMKSWNRRKALSLATMCLRKRMKKMKSMAHRKTLKRKIMRWSFHLNIITILEKITTFKIKLLGMTVKYKERLLMEKKKWSFRMALGGKLSQMAILLFISIIMMLSRLILIKKSFIILLKLRPLRPHSLMDCKCLNFLIVRLRSIFQMELKKLFSLTELLNVYLLMERKNQYLQMVLSKELKRLELKP